ncbi:CatB-related O-acetyltransferase [Bdellovibrio sp. KM01]|uniref:CatB-related O-acetyltransferase n=1 Tax=Bdellovibrio sp. KM01 TaxID=2748865 RepID=UPI0015EAAD64|nr:CatB-related O-acetyltransferase [Bdellovibrio sp. KM01]QLY26610.1 CatB-related O-acetyltransferase [Bdellovibrio sp. KM01]
MSNNYFSSPFAGKSLKEQTTNPNIIVGEYSYYSGYYHGHSFDDCAWYLPNDRSDVDKLYIGKFCSIGSGASFLMGGNQGHRKEWVSTYPFAFITQDPTFQKAQNSYRPAGDTVIGNDVWIGAEAMIMPGVRVGNGCVIGARTMVTKNIEPYTIVVGGGEVVRKRFSDPEISMLMEMNWWDWSKEALADAMPLLTSNDIVALYRFWEKRKTQSPAIL